MQRYIFTSLFLLSLFLSACTPSIRTTHTGETYEEVLEKFPTDFNSRNKESFSFRIPPGSKINSFNVETSKKEVTINLSKEFAAIPYRKETVEKIYTEIKEYFSPFFDDYKFNIISLNKPIEELIPNYYREKRNYDIERNAKEKSRPVQLIKKINRPFEITKGLEAKNILLWHSHGWYYNNKSNKWEWQRPRLFQTVEDLLPMSFTIPYLIPMLENSGATVFVPRERDIQKNEVIVDNDTDFNINYFEKFSNKMLSVTEFPKGFKKKKSYKENENPFELGSSKRIIAQKNPSVEISWIPEIPETGEYAVNISYQQNEENVTDAHYTVIHTGGETEFYINQQIGGGTWIYLGHFHFEKGKKGKVVLTNKSENGKFLSADAVRFGGGMGIIERNGSTSKRPKFVEGARYWLQFAGMPDTLVYNLNNSQNDYNDDYQSRAEYGNYLKGNPFGPNKKRDEKGLGIPVDLSIAFHTDAGITKNDTVVGTLAIYSLEGGDSLLIFPDKVSRFANRDFADIVQTQIVNDIKELFDQTWSRRGLREAQYSEAFRPNMPSFLLELLSHQNFLDMRFANDPRFKFYVSRAIYKGALRFLSVYYGFEYVVHPLPVTHFQALIINNKIELSWQQQIDPLEKTANAKHYVVYTRKNDGGFNNGVLVKDNKFTINNFEDNVIYSFKITAVNDGGESFPSEILSVAKAKKDNGNVLIINNFDRISAPSVINENNFAGFTTLSDFGVPDKFDINFTGLQFNFNPDDEFKTNSNPGWGASNSDFETEIIAGNSLDYPFIHGKYFIENGFSFSSSSNEAFEENNFPLNKFQLIDVINGKEKTIEEVRFFNTKLQLKEETFSNKFINKISNYLSNGGNLFISGAYIGRELWKRNNNEQISFGKNFLKINYVSEDTSTGGKVFPVANKFIQNNINFNTKLNDKIYHVESPEIYLPEARAEILMRYNDKNYGAVTGFKGNFGTVISGFPFETISDKDKSLFIKSVLKYLELIK